MDILAKLTNWAKYSTAGQKTVILEAKDEIERLREALAECAEPFSGTEPDALTALRVVADELDRRCKIARSALQQKESE